MSEHARLSELVGIRADAEESEAIWPLNVVLCILGATILGVAFSFLDTAEPRLLYNPWTYAIATPIALLGLSALLSVVVSRLVEKSMQMAFLLSVLIHLGLIVCAMNVVVFSRMWPDVLDSLAQQREQLKRESLQAKQYHRISSASQTGRRPDYLKPAQTEHQPTEIERVDAPALTLARSQRANLVSPSPKMEITHSPHLMERDKPASTLPNTSPQPASLSRSDVTRQAPPEFDSIPDSQQLDETEDLTLGPSDSTVARRASTQRPKLLEPPTVSGSEQSTIRPQVALPRSESQLNSQVNSTPAESLDRSRLSAARPLAKSPESLTLTEAHEDASGLAENLSSATRSERRRSERSPLQLLADLPDQAVAVRPPPQLNMQRLDAMPQLPIPQASDNAAALSRNVAGGRLGASAPSSMPVRGIEDFGVPAASESLDPIIAKSSVAERRSGEQQAVAQLPNLGSPDSSSWNGAPSLANGLTGRSPSQLAQESNDGTAAQRDTAGLTGSGQAIERSSLSQAETRGPVSPAQIDTRAGEAFDESTGRAATSELTAEAASIERAKSGGRSPSLPLSDQWTGAKESTPASMGISSREFLRAESTSSPTDLPDEPGAIGIIKKSEQLAIAAPMGVQGKVKIETPDELDQFQVADDRLETNSNSPAGAVRRSATERRSGDVSLPSTLLAIDQPAQFGGIAASVGETGSLLQRRDAETQDLAPPQFEAQRFARQDVGGRLAAGQQVALPKPAFQQRLDRLQDRNPQDESSLEPQTELAIENGLACLARHQRSDGSWRLQDFDTHVLMRSDTAATGLAILAFQGAGYTHNQFKYKDTVNRAVQFLVRNQRVDGDLYIPQDPASDQNAWLYSHAIASLALCESVGMTQDEELRPAAQRAIDFMVASQDPVRGGWRYRPGVGADTSVTGWFMMAFKSGQLAGLKVPSETFPLIENFVAASQSTEPHLYRYNPFASDTPQQRHGLKPTSVMTSVGLLIRLYFGWQRERPEMIAGADYLLDHLPENGTASVSRRDTYYWYYATQVMFHMRGERWQKWHDRLYPLLIESQISGGEWAGSWDPTYPTPDLWARYGGRLYVTTMNLLSLEVSYRHLPLYEATAQ